MRATVEREREMVASKERLRGSGMRLHRRLAPPPHLRDKRPAALLHADGALVEIRVPVPAPKERAHAVGRVSCPGTDVRALKPSVVEPGPLAVRAHELDDVGERELGLMPREDE